MGMRFSSFEQFARAMRGDDPKYNEIMRERHKRAGYEIPKKWLKC